VEAAGTGWVAGAFASVLAGVAGSVLAAVTFEFEAVEVGAVVVPAGSAGVPGETGAEAV
jgi:hypothetical protein